MINQINNSLTKICHKLSGGSWFGQGAYNYVVDVELFCTEFNSDLSFIGSIEKLLPNAVIREIEGSDLQELISTVKECFEFNGDEGSHPNKKYLKSKEFKNDLNEVLQNIKTLFFENLEISKFWLKDGHPFYPVYWDYAFLVIKSDFCFILIGSSSD